MQNENKKYVFVSGGQFGNKGAQALVFTVMSEIKRLHPDKEIILLTYLMKYREENKNYRLRYEKMPGLKGILFSTWAIGINAKRRQLYKNAAAFIDISGYRLGKRFGPFSALRFLNVIRLAKHYQAPVYLMPQSYGPFEYGVMTPLIKMLMRKLIPYAKVFAREEEGVKMLKQVIRRLSVEKKPDLILMLPKPVPSVIYKKVPEIRRYSIESGSVALIPNSKNEIYNREGLLDRLYIKIIELVISSGHQVYILSHSTEDQKIIKRLMSELPADMEGIHIIEDELNCLEYEALVRDFDFIIASRYHAIIHSYKEGVPALIMGWAVKYRELAELFGQESYCIDLKSADFDTAVIKSVEKMLITYEKEKKVIEERMRLVIDEHFFERVVL